MTYQVTGPAVRSSQILTAQDVLAATPVLPESLEALGMLRSGARVHGSDARHCVIWNETGRLVVVQGNPSPESLFFALENCPQAVSILVRRASSGNWGAVLAGWRPVSAARFILKPGRFRPPLLARDAEFFDGDKHGHMLPGLAGSFRDELLEAHSDGPVAISIDGGCIAAYCFAGWNVLNFFDICAVTLPAFRRRGHALTCCSALISLFTDAGKDPQWVTHSTNRPSIELARRLGFRRLESLLLFRREPHLQSTVNGESHG